jgi:YHS domain-containing protein
MFRFFVLYVIRPLLIFAFLRWLLHALFGSVTPSPQDQPPPQPAPPVLPAGGELKRDPVCGTYVSALASPWLTVDGETYYFCSLECKEKFHP